MEESHKRGIDGINEMLQLAKLSEQDVMPLSQTLYFADENLQQNNYKFLELDGHLLSKISKGQTLYFKGEEGDNVVLCSDEYTYDVASHETSNSLLLVENMKFFDDVKNETERSFSTFKVAGIFYDSLSVTLSKPKLQKLKEILNKSMYKGPELEFEIKPENLYSFEELNEIVQASEKELREILERMYVVKVENKIRLLDVQYHFRVLSYMLQLIDENSWKLDEIDYGETLNALKDLVPEEILINLLDKYTIASKIVDGLQLYSYKEREVCKFFAEILLYGAGKFNLDEFLQAWKESVPEGMVPEEELLHGIAIIDRKSNPNVIRRFPEEDLPDDINARFEALFRAKIKWTVPEITPYIQRVATPTADVNMLLAKHARASILQGVKYYSAKHHI